MAKVRVWVREKSDLLLFFMLEKEEHSASDVNHQSSVIILQAKKREGAGVHGILNMFHDSLFHESQVGVTC